MFNAIAQSSDTTRTRTCDKVKFPQGSAPFPVSGYLIATSSRSSSDTVPSSRVTGRKSFARRFDGSLSDWSYLKKLEIYARKSKRRPLNPVTQEILRLREKSAPRGYKTK